MLTTNPTISKFILFLEVKEVINACVSIGKRVLIL